MLSYGARQGGLYRQALVLKVGELRMINTRLYNLSKQVSITLAIGITAVMLFTYCSPAHATGNSVTFNQAIKAQLTNLEFTSNIGGALRADLLCFVAQPSRINYNKIKSYGYNEFDMGYNIAVAQYRYNILTDSLKESLLFECADLNK